MFILKYLVNPVYNFVINSANRGSPRNDAKFGSFSKHGRFAFPNEIDRSSHSNASPCNPSSA